MGWNLKKLKLAQGGTNLVPPRSIKNKLLKISPIPDFQTFKIPSSNT
jgi:hypothetical protein